MEVCGCTLAIRFHVVLVVIATVIVMNKFHFCCEKSSACVFVLKDYMKDAPVSAPIAFIAWGRNIY